MPGIPEAGTLWRAKWNGQVVMAVVLAGHTPGEDGPPIEETIQVGYAYPRWPNFYSIVSLGQWQANFDLVEGDHDTLYRQLVQAAEGMTASTPPLPPNLDVIEP